MEIPIAFWTPYALTISPGVTCCASSLKLLVTCSARCISLHKGPKRDHFGTESGAQTLILGFLELSEQFGGLTKFSLEHFTFFRVKYFQLELQSLLLPSVL